MNRIHRKVWSRRLGAWVVVAETARSHGRGSARSGQLLASVLLSGAAGLAAAADPGAATLPQGGQVTQGQASIATQGSALTVTQGSARAAIDWTAFSIGRDASVEFRQPSTAAIALNRVTGSDPSQIFGVLRANGQVFLVNPNGVLFAPGARADAAGLLLTTREVDRRAFENGQIRLSGSGNATVVNRGSLNAHDGGYVALVGAQVVNEGQISAPLGDVRLAAAEQATLQLDGQRLLGLTIDRGAFDALVANHGLIQADGGRVYLTAAGRDALSRASVNHTGVIEARTVGEHEGTIVLLGDMQVGSTTVEGRLDASAPNGGRGGFVETSAAHVNVADSARVDTHARDGSGGHWLIDPFDFIVAASGGNMSNTTLSTNLGSGDVSIQSTTGNSGTAGNVIIADPVSWSANRLTLNAQNDILINANLNGSGSAQLTLAYGLQSAGGGNSTYTLADAARIDLPAGNNLTIQKGSGGAANVYQVINTLGVDASSSPPVTATGLYVIRNNLAGRYALGADISIDPNNIPLGAGTMAFGTASTPFTGDFEGLGHSISHLPSTYTGLEGGGMFGEVGSAGRIGNLKLTNIYVKSASDGLGAFAGKNAGLIEHVLVSGIVEGKDEDPYNDVGGIAGINSGTIRNATVHADVSGRDRIGGVAGSNTGSISAALVGPATVGQAPPQIVTSDQTAGGLVGRNNGSLSDSVSTAAVLGVRQLGGAVGLNQAAGTISGLTLAGASGALPNATVEVGGAVGRNEGSVTTVSTSVASVGTVGVGGLVGVNATGASLTDSSASGVAVGTNQVGGAIGYNQADVSLLLASGGAIGTSLVGGLIGESTAAVDQTQASGTVTASSGDVGGLIGKASAAVTNSLASGNVSGGARAGGLIGWSTVAVDGNQASGNVSGSTQVGGFIGQADLAVSNASAIGSASGSSQVGGLVGWAKAAVTSSSARGAVVGSADSIGGLIGLADGAVDGSSASGAVTGRERVGGLIGVANAAVSNSSTGLTGSSGTVTVTAVGPGPSFPAMRVRAGGLIGEANANLSGVSAIGAVTATGSGKRADVGGLAGWLGTGVQVSGATASGNVTASGVSEVGGLIGGTGTGVNITKASSSGSVSGANSVGGLVGMLGSGSSIQGGTGVEVSSSSNVTANSSQIGGLVGWLEGNISQASASGNVSGGDAVGGLVGWSSFVTIAQSSASGSVSGNYMVGGLVGNSNATISGSSTSGGAVTGATDYVGGLVGTTTRPISNSSASKTVTGQLYVGGLAGRLEGSSNTVTGSTASGSVTGTESVGGLVGLSQGSIDGSSFTSGSVHGDAAVGGLVGELSGGRLTHGNSAAAVTGDHWVGGAVGSAYNAVAEHLRTTGAVTGTGGDEIGGVIGSSNSTTITDIGATGNVQAGIGSSVGGALGSVNNSSVTQATASGHVSGGGYVGGLIGALSDSSLSSGSASGNVSGDNSIGGLIGGSYSSAVSASSASGQVSVSGEIGGGFVGDIGGGSIVGSSATGAVSGGDKVGGFAGWVESGSTIGSSSATGNVSGHDAVGGFIGLHEGSVTLSSTSGSEVVGHNAVGGFAGVLTGEITAVHISRNARGVAQVGGLVGDAHVDSGAVRIADSSAGGQVTGGSDAGGLVGDARGVVIERAAATGAVSGSDRVGGLIGRMQADTQLTASTASGAVQGVNDVGGLIGKVDASAVVVGTGPFGVTALGNDTSSTVAGTGTGVGGFVGRNAGEVHDVIAANAVTGSGGSVSGVGGAVGVNSGRLYQSRAHNAVTAAGGADVGGLVGANVDGGQVYVSYADNAVVGDTAVGGLIGRQTAGGTAHDVYAAGSASGNQNVGGLVGDLLGSVTDSYAKALVTAPGGANQGGFAGQVGTPGVDVTVTRGQFDLSASGQAHANADAVNVGELASGRSGAEMVAPGTYADWSLSSEGGSNAVWRLYDGAATPLLRYWLTPLAMSGTGSSAQVDYDGQTHSVAVTNVQWTDTLSGSHVFGVARGGSGSIQGRDAGIYNSLQGVGSDQLGYDIAFGAGLQLQIDPALLTLHLPVPTSKEYSGNRAATVNPGQFTIEGLIPGESLVVTAPVSGLFNGKNVRDATLVTVPMSLNQLTGNGGTRLGNYRLASPSVDVTGPASITPKPMQAWAQADDKVYDGSRAATGMVGIWSYNGDDVVVNGTLTFSDKNVGQAKTVASSGLSLSGVDAGNYALTGPDPTTTAHITPRPLNLRPDSADKVYDGNRSAVGTLGAPEIVPGDDLQIAGQALFIDANAGVGKRVDVTGISGSGADLGNYSFPNALQTQATITPRTLTVTLLAQSKVYDSHDAQALAPDQFSFGNLVAGEGVAVGSSLAGAFNSANVRDATQVSVPLSLQQLAAGQGTLLSNYQLATPTLEVLAAGVITPLSLRPWATAVDKVYDGNSAATGTLGIDSYQRDDVRVEGLLNFSDKNAATGKTVTGSALTLAGADASNYALSDRSASTTAAITPRPLNLRPVGADKVYDADRSAMGDLSAAEIVPGDDLRIAGQALFVDPNAGNGKRVDFSRITGSGADLGNYSFPSALVALASITRRPITVTLLPVQKVYDGSTEITLEPGHFVIGGVVEGENLLLPGALTGQFNSPNVRDAAQVATLLGAGRMGAGQGTSLDNYEIPAGVRGAGSITPRPLQVDLAARDKTYDGNTGVDATFSLRNVVAGELVGVRGHAAFVDANAGVAKGVNGSDLALEGEAAVNYVIATPAPTTNANIAPKQLLLRLRGPVQRYVDGTTVATLTPDQFEVIGLIGSEQLEVTQTTGSYASPVPGQAIRVSTQLAAGDFRALGSALLANYQLPMGELAGDVGVLTDTTQIVATLATLPNMAGGLAMSATPQVGPPLFGAPRDGAGGILVQEAANSVAPAADEATGTPADANSPRRAPPAFTPMQVLEKTRRAFSVLDGGLRLPAGVRGGALDAPADVPTDAPAGTAPGEPRR